MWAQQRASGNARINIRQGAQNEKEKSTTVACASASAQMVVGSWENWDMVEVAKAEASDNRDLAGV